MLKTSYIELNKKALHNNIRFMRDEVCGGARYSMVIKANGYGHGLEEVLTMAEEGGVDHFSVFSAAEAKRALEVKKSGTEIMLMGWMDRDQMEWIVQNGISFFVFTLERLHKARELAEKLKKPARVHLELETGMNRTGFDADQMEEVVKILRQHPDAFTIEGMCTHYAGAESISNYDRVKNQIKRFNEICRNFAEVGIKPRYRHTACSAAAFSYPATIMDLVRIGIANYGFWPGDEIRMSRLIEQEHTGRKPIDPLERVITWKSCIMSTKKVPEGEYINYGRTYLTNRDTLIATIPVGYGYGYTRNLSNLGHVLIHGRRVNIVGSVNMNMMVVDVTDLDRVAIGDEVVLIGSQGGITITVSSFGDWTNSLNYELLTRLPVHIPRYITTEN